MKHVIIVLVILQVIAARPQQNKNAKLTQYENFNDGLGNFNYTYQTDNGITLQQIGQPKSVDSATNVVIMRGLLSVVSPDSTTHEVRYISDENGYHSQFSITTPYLRSLNAKSSDSQQAESTGVPHQNTEVQKRHDNESQPQMVITPPVLNVTNTTAHNNTNQTGTEEFPDRIGTPVIITLMGPPG